MYFYKKILDEIKICLINNSELTYIIFQTQVRLYFLLPEIDIFYLNVEYVIVHR